MTQSALTPTPAYTVQGTGPYTITHGYSAKGDITAAVILNDQRTDLVLDTDFFVSPDGAPSSGTVTLSSAAASAYAGGQLFISRATVTDQGWLGTQGAREAGLEAQLDKLAQGLQDVQRDLQRAMRLDYALGVLALKPNSLVAVDANKQIYAEDPNILSQLTPDFAQTQAYIDSLVANYLPLSSTTSWSQGLLADADASAGRTTLGVHAQTKGISSSYTVASADNRVQMYVTATATLTLPDPAAVGSDFMFDVTVTGGSATFAATAGNIYGLSGEALYVGDSARVTSNGTDWWVKAVQRATTAKEGLVLKATAADLAAGTNGAWPDCAVVKGYADGTANFSGIGYQKLPGGLIFQWGRVSVAGSSTSAAQSFAIAFPNFVLAMVGNVEDLNAAAASEDGGTAKAISTTQYTCTNASPGTRVIAWHAIGY